MGLAQRDVAIGIAAEWSLRQIEQTDARVTKCRDRVPGAIRASIGDDEKLEIRLRLPKHREDGVAEQLGSIVCRQQDSNARGVGSKPLVARERRCPTPLQQAHRNARRRRAGRPDLGPLIGDELFRLRRIPHQFPAVGRVMVIEHAGHADYGRFVVADVFPAVIHPGRNEDQPLISFSEHELVDGSISGRRPSPVVADDA